jgi:hypothetical protein
MAATPSPPGRRRMDSAGWLALATAIVGFAGALVDFVK